MRLITLPITITFIAFSAAALLAQSWEVGGGAAYGFYRQVGITAPSITGNTGLSDGAAFSVVGGNDMYRHLGGEVRYTYRSNDLKLSAGGTTVRRNAESHAVHYDFLVYATKRGTRIRPFAAGGAGIKYFRGTGSEVSFQPLSDVAVLTHASEVKPLVTFGGGVKTALSRHALLRFDFRDYATPFPEKVIAARGGVQLSGWLHDFVFLGGISLTFD
jgi:hypothetical protein